MANTYYKYVEKTADDFVDWSAIGKQMSNVFIETNKVREATKADIDEKSRQYGIELSEPPQGESVTGNQYALDLANEATSAKLMQLNLLKSGQLKLKDYLVQNQNLKDGTKDAFSVMKEFQESYKTTMDRLKADESQDLEGFLHAEAEGFGDFTKSKLYINPTDFTVSVAMKDKNIDANGRETYAMSKNPNKFTTVSALRNRIKGRFDKYDVDKNMAGFVDRLGEETTALVKIKNSYGATGIVSLLTDITARKNLPKDVQGVLMKFEDAETKALQAQLTNPFNVTSILTNSIMNAPNGKQYTFTWDKAERDNNPNMILLTNKSDGTPIPVFTDEQEKAALEHLRLQARLMYDKKEKIETTNQLQKQFKTEYASKDRGDAKDRESAATLWNKIYYAKTPAERESAAQAVMSLMPEIEFIDVSVPGKVSIKYGEDSQGRDLSQYSRMGENAFSMIGKDGKPISLFDWAAAGAEVHGEKDANKAIKAGGGKGEYTDFNAYQLKGMKVKREGKPDEAEKTPEIKITPDIFLAKSQIAAPNLKSMIPKDFYVTDIGGYFGNEVQVIAPDSQIYKFKTDVGAANATLAVQGLNKFINEHKTPPPPPTTQGTKKIDYSNK
jgi:hypothetical protein